MKYTLFKWLGILIILLVFSNCEPSLEENNPQQENINSKSITSIPIEDFLELDTYKKFKVHQKNRKQHNKKNNSIPNYELKYRGNRAMIASVNDQKTYSIAVETDNRDLKDYKLTLLIRENPRDTSLFLVKHPKNNGDITIHPINLRLDNVLNKHSSVSKSSVKCEAIFWEVDTPCACGPAHTSPSQCSCPDGPSGDSGTILVCWDLPIEVTTSPDECCNSSGGSGGGGFAGGGGGPQDSAPDTYIYEGEEQCFSNGECTPPLYWAQTQVEVSTVGDRLIDLLNIVNLNSNGLTNSQKQWILDSDNTSKVDDLLSFLTKSNNSNEAKEYSKFAIEIMMDDNSLNFEDTYVVEPPEKQEITNMKEFLSCIDTTKNATLTIYADQPITGSSFPTNEDIDPGHAFVSIEQNGNTVVFGFYPKQKAKAFTAADGAIYNNQGDKYDTSITLNISASVLKNIINFTNTIPNKYNINFYNCTDYVIDISNFTNEGLPNCWQLYPGGGGSCPAVLGEYIRDLPDSSAYTLSKSTSQAPLQSGDCN